ncbi:MAG: FAD-dependent oxidoreductase [Bacilli bacterium]|nr:FAD-dependent oxidoreductase [Bacilli bacterium]
MSVAAKLRRLDKNATITVYEKGHDISYAACGMPYFLGGVIEDEASLQIKTLEDFTKQAIDVYTNHEVITVIPEKREVHVYNHDTNQISIDTYDTLVIATGASAKRTFVSGANSKGIYVLKNLEDAITIKQQLSKASKIAVIGGGYIGCEVAENLAHIGKSVVLIENNNQILDLFDYDIARQVEVELETVGVEVHTRERLESYQQDGDRILVNTNESTYPVDLVIEAIGIQPNTTFLKELNMKMLPNGAIMVNEYLETSIPHIYAAGDCVAYRSRFFGEHVYLPLATHAVSAGKIIAQNIIGKLQSFNNVIGSTIIKVGKLSIAKTGLTLEEAQARKLNVGFVDVTAETIPHYYPGGTEIRIRIIYENGTGTLKGAEIISEKNVNSDINLMALAISKEMTAEEFSTIDFPYSPPFSPVNNPFQIASRKIEL